MPSRKETERYAALARPSPNEKGNLIMQLNVGDVVSIGDNVELVVTGLETSESRRQVRLAVRAPRSILISKRRQGSE